MNCTYHPLQDPENIRLVRVWPHRHYKDDFVHISLFGHKHEEAPAYEALSYVWGSRDNQREIKNGGGSHFVTSNLHAALVELQADAGHREDSEQPPVLVWIDALCINQEDDLEKSNQVRRMKAIYEHAQRVLAWLGEEDEFTEQAFDLLEQYASLCNDSETRDNVKTWSITKAGQDALRSIFKRSYFTRLWVLQEYAVCGKVALRCGQKELTIEVFNAALDRLLQYTDTITWAAIDAANASLVVKARYNFRDCGETPDLLHCLFIGLNKNVSDPRDKVFGLLGLADNNVTAAISADYSKMVQDAYRDVARYVLQANGDLSIFSFAGLGRANVPGLPSWVPDWSRPSSGMNIEHKSKWAFENEKQFKAHNGMAYVYASAKNFGAVSCRGVGLDRISSTHDVLREVLNHTSGPYTFPTPEEFFAFLENLGLSGLYPFAGEDYKSVFFRTLSADTTAYGGRLRSVDRLVLFKRYCEAEKSGLLEGWDPEEVWEESLSYVVFTLVGRVFFITRKGYLGIGPGTMRVGDEVCVLVGGTVPFVLRPMAQIDDDASSQEYQLLGECYVHGVMEGEAIRDAKEGDFEDFILV